MTVTRVDTVTEKCNILLNATPSPCWPMQGANAMRRTICYHKSNFPKINKNRLHALTSTLLLASIYRVLRVSLTIRQKCWTARETALAKHPKQITQNKTLSLHPWRTGLLKTTSGTYHSYVWCCIIAQLTYSPRY